MELCSDGIPCSFALRNIYSCAASEMCEMKRFALAALLHHHGYVVAGSFSFSMLSGKVMFRDIHFITEDYAVHIQLGLAIFRWWRPLILKEITEGLWQHHNQEVSDEGQF